MSSKPEVPKSVISLQLSEAQKKLVQEEQAQTLAAQENIKISGSNARHMVMQKLMRDNQEVIIKYNTDKLMSAIIMISHYR